MTQFDGGGLSLHFHSWKAGSDECSAVLTERARGAASDSPSEALRDAGERREDAKRDGQRNRPPDHKRRCREAFTCLVLYGQVQEGSDMRHPEP